MPLRFEYSAGAFVYTIENGKLLFLVLKREKDHDIPKGHIEKGESAIEAAKREVKEETGLEPEFLPYFSLTTKYFFYDGKTKVLKTVKFFIAKSVTSKVTISSEHTGYSWLSYDEAMKTVEYKDLKEALPEVKDYIMRYEEVLKTNNEYSKLPNKTARWGLSKTFVPGEGPLNAEIMILGQAPGVQEDRQRRPFVGRSGQLLTELLSQAGIKREKAYITSVVGFYPPNNRAPTDEEIRQCMPFLEKLIKTIKPKHILLLGSIASKALLGSGSVSAMHGKTFRKGSIDYFVTFHPAAALRFKSIKALMETDLKNFASLALANKT
ncbi:MAG: uracil-DNA glycosylase family protein [Candidatus Micrarchaeia archaeon]